MATLTDTAIKAAKPASKPFRLSDGKGLYLLIQPIGSKWWRFDYRFDGARKTLSMGTYPEVNLKQARAYRDEARQLIANSTDPAELRRVEKNAVIEAEREKAEAFKIEAMIQSGEALPGSFEEADNEWASRYLADKTEKYRSKVINRLKATVYPYIGREPVADVNAPMVLQVLQRIEARGYIESAHRVKQNIGQILRYAIATGRRELFDVTMALNKAIAPMPKDKNHAAPTEPKDIAPILRIMAGYKGSAITRAALIIAPCVFVRIGELRHMLWEDINFETCEWRYLASKTEQEHIVPLARQVIDALRELQPLTGHSRYVFTGARSHPRPMSENTVNGELKRLGIDTQTELTGHGFRAMARTVLEEVHGFRPEIIELQLAHVVRDPLGRAYNRTKHLETRKNMMQVWADYLDALREPNNVVVGQFGKTA
jgi:integrase